MLNIRQTKNNLVETTLFSLHCQLFTPTTGDNHPLQYQVSAVHSPSLHCCIPQNVAQIFRFSSLHSHSYSIEKRIFFELRSFVSLNPASQGKYIPHPNRVLGGFNEDSIHAQCLKCILCVAFHLNLVGSQCTLHRPTICSIHSSDGISLISKSHKIEYERCDWIACHLCYAQLKLPDLINSG